MKSRTERQARAGNDDVDPDARFRPGSGVARKILDHSGEIPNGEIAAPARVTLRSDAKSEEPRQVFSRICNRPARQIPSFFVTQLPEKTEEQTRPRLRCTRPRLEKESTRYR